MGIKLRVYIIDDRGAHIAHPLEDKYWNLPKNHWTWIISLWNILNIKIFFLNNEILNKFPIIKKGKYYSLIEK